MDTLHNWGAREIMARKMKERRIAIAQARRRVIPAPSIEPEIAGVDVFHTSSGFRAYRKRMPNLWHLGVLYTEKASGIDVTLPWVSMLGEAR